MLHIPGRTALTALGLVLALAVTALPAAADEPVSPEPSASSTVADEPVSPGPSASSAVVDEPVSPVPSASSAVVADPVSPEPSTASTVPDEPVAAPGTGPEQATYAGVTLDVPEGWAVVDLDADPTACVRLDVHAVYLGTQGPAPRCPSTLVGRSSSIQLQTVPAELPYGTVTLAAGSAPALTAAQQTAGELVGVVAGTRVLVTVSFTGDFATLAPVLATLQASPAPAARLAAGPSAMAVAAETAPLDASFTRYYGKGFDACTAPTLSTMAAWGASPYRSIGVYIGGVARGCAQPNLTASWLRSLASTGWHAQPIYVGLQAPCSQFGSRITYGKEWDQGRAAALDAIARAQALGLGAGSDIFYDMESYPQGPQCSGSVRAYLSSWTSTLKFNGFTSGVYSSLSTGIEDLASGAGQPGFVPPDKIWIARWNGVPSIYGHEPSVADNQWAPYSRMHQYNGGHNETFGGVTINIDNNLLDTDPNRGSPTGQIDTVTTTPARITATGWAIDPDTSNPIIVQLYIDGVYAAMVSANGARPDVGAAFPAAGPNHGYSVQGRTTAGKHSACLYAVNSGPGTSRQLGCRTVTVPSSNPFGQIDLAKGTPGKVTASGWAIDPDTASPIIVQMYVDGSRHALTTANAARSDVGKVFPAAGPNHGYTISLSAPTGTHTVCVYAINTGPGVSQLLGCRTVWVPSSDPMGHVDGLSASGGTITARGWAIDPKTTAPIIVQMYVDGSRYAMAWANISRSDIAAAFPGYGAQHGFSLSLAASPGTHTVCVYAVNSGVGPSPTLACSKITV